MRVVFFKDVANVANSGDVKEVSDGYARNFLIPKGLAAMVTPQVISQLEAQIASQNKKQAQMAEELTKLAEQLNGSEITIEAKVGARDKLYGSVTSADIAEELTKTSGIDIDKRKVELTEPIRETGSYEVAVRLGKDALPRIKVTVKGQESG